MKKKFVAAICAFALAMAMPVAAFADGSAEQDNSQAWPTDNGFVSIAGDVEIYSVTDAGPAANTPADAKVLASYEIDGKVLSGEATVGLWYGGLEDVESTDDYYVTVFIQHEGWNEQRVVKQPYYATSAVVTVSEFSTFTVVEGAYYGTAPKTGVEAGGVAVATVAAAICACGVAYVIRKKVVA